MYKCYSLPEKKSTEAGFQQLHADNNINTPHFHLKVHAAIVEKCDAKKCIKKG